MKRTAVILCVLALTACAQAEPTATPLPLTATPTVAQTPTDTLPPHTETATGTAQSLLADQPYVSEAYGYSVAYPIGWQPVAMGDVLIFVADVAAISNNTPTRAVTITTGPLDIFLGGMLVGVPLESAGAVLVAVVPELLGGGFRLGEFESLTVGDLLAIGGPLSGQEETGIAVKGFVTLILTDQRAAFLLGSAPADQWESFEPVYMAILETFVFTLP